MPEKFARDSINIGASASHVWDVLTEAEYTRQYMFGCEPVSDWHAGSPLLWRGAADGKVYVKGAIVSIVPTEILQYTTFTPNAFDNYEDKPENYTTVTLELSASGPDTTLSVSQGDFSRIASGDIRFAHTVQSWRTVLGKIKEIAEGT